MASANDMFQKVGRATATTLSAPGYTTGDSSVNIGSTTNWPTDTGVTFAIDVVDAAGERIAGTYNVFRGRVAGASQVDQVVYEGGDAHRSYPSGATTRVYILVSSYRDNRMVDGLMISHNQDGTIKGPSVVTALTGQTLPANTVTTPAIADGAVAYAKLLSTIFSGQLTTYTNPGTAGGTFYYGDIGGIKIFYGKTQSNAVGTGGASYTITLPVGFFSTIRYSAPTVDTYTIDDRQWATTVTVTTATYTLGIKSSSNGSTQVTNVLILGT